MSSADLKDPPGVEPVPDPKIVLPAQKSPQNSLGSPEAGGGGGGGAEDVSSNEEDEVVEKRKCSLDQEDLLPIPPPVPKAGISILAHKLWIGNLDNRLTE